MTDRTMAFTVVSGACACQVPIILLGLSSPVITAALLSAAAALLWVAE